MWYLRGEIMNDYASLDTAIEIMAYKITDCVKRVEENPEKYEKELEELREERNKMYSGDMKTIQKIIDIYGKELRKKVSK